jgi:hypothetical protein
VSGSKHIVRTTFNSPGPPSCIYCDTPASKANEGGKYERPNEYLRTCVQHRGRFQKEEQTEIGHERNSRGLCFYCEEPVKEGRPKTNRSERYRTCSYHWELSRGTR